jgi:hypothetical protein
VLVYLYLSSFTSIRTVGRYGTLLRFHFDETT